MRIIKNYEQYIKESKKIKVNEDVEEFDDVPENEMDSDNPLNQGIEDEDPTMDMDEMPGEDEMPSEIDEVEDEMPSDEFQDETPSHEFQEEESGEEADEEEGYQYKGSQMLNKLANMLGAEVTNNAIMYDGKKINFYSETEMFHVDRKKFKTPEEVVQYINSSEQTEPTAASAPAPVEQPMDGEINEPVGEEEMEPMMMEESHKSYRKNRKFESFRKK